LFSSLMTGCNTCSLSNAILPGVKYALHSHDAFDAWHGQLNVSFSPGGSARNNGGMQM
jgi:hypothetical protein